MRHELSEIPDDSAGLRFAAGCLRATIGLAIAARWHAMRAGARSILRPFTPSTWSFVAMHDLSRPRSIGLFCGVIAVAMGLAYMLAAGAPSRLVLVNLGALVLGAAAWLGLGRAARSQPGAVGPLILAMAVALLLTAWFGAASDGASRWVTIGPLALQTSLILLPAMIILYSRRPDAIGTAGMTIAALALALQPDRGMAGALAAGLGAFALARPDRLAIIAAAAAIASFCGTLLMPDRLPAMPYVDSVLYTAFDLHPLAGSAVLFGTAALLVPALLCGWRGADERPILLAFGACWAGIVLAAALGHYPTPLVGYGGSAVLGYLLSVALLPSEARLARAGGMARAAPRADRGSDRIGPELRIAPAS
jgi:hypothetical protein